MLIRCLLFLLSCSLFLAGCSDDEAPVRLGLIASVTGVNADGGQAGRNGVLLAVEEISRAGGINGRPVELIVHDDGNSPERSAAAARDLVDERVTAIIGPFTSSTAKAVRSVTEPAEMLVFSPTVMSDEFSGMDDSFFRLSPITSESARNYAEFLTKQRRGRRFALMIDATNLAFTRPYAEAFRSAIQALGGETVLDVEGNFHSFVGFNDLIRRLRESKADTLFLLTTAVNAARIIQQVRKVDSTMTIAAIEWAATWELIHLGGKAAEGVLIAHNLDLFSTGKRYLRFVENYRRRFEGKPNFTSLTAYETVMVLCEALAKRKDGESVKQAILANRPYQGLQQTLTIDDYGDSRRKSYIGVIKDAEFAPAP